MKDLIVDLICFEFFLCVTSAYKVLQLEILLNYNFLIQSFVVTISLSSFSASSSSEGRSLVLL